MQITILGAGKIGQAIKNILNDDLKVFLWDKQIGLVPNQSNIPEIVPSSDLVFFCVPSSGFSEAVISIRSYLKHSATIIFLTKGVEASSGKFMYEILRENFKSKQIALLTGPMLAEEMLQGKGAAAVLASKNKKILEILQKVIKRNSLKMEFTVDIRSASWAGVLKNIYTIALGMIDGLGFGENIRGYLVSAIMAEMLVISKEFRINKNMIFGTAGLADLLATSYSSYSLNRQAGQEIALGRELRKTEGSASLPWLVKTVVSLDRLPILLALSKIILEHQDPKKTFENLIYS